MESNFRNNEFEELLQQSADQYRMFPSTKVWDDIHTHMHPQRKWYGFAVIFLLLMTGIAVGLVMWTGSPIDQKKIAQTIIKDNSGTKAISSVKEAPLSNIHPLLLNNPKFVAKQQRQAPFISTPSIHKSETTNNNSTNALKESKDFVQTIANDNIMANFPNVKIGNHSTHTKNNLLIAETKTDLAIEELLSTKEITETKNLDPNKAFAVNVAKDKNQNVSKAARRQNPKRFSWQIHLAPTVSYRKLSENKGFMQAAAQNGNVPYFAAFNDVKTFVKHKPDLGLEFGLATKYPVFKFLKLRTGFQFNISRYDIMAYNNTSEIATIALNQGSVAAGSRSISRRTSYRSRSGGRSSWLQNLYFSASVPIGIEFNFPGQSSNTFLSFAGTIQPTYIISNRAYLLSTDYKNYVEVPSLTRLWNTNVGFEAMLNYGKGKTKWQVGPQVRYQLKSSFVDLYPLTENLFDFGLKIGVTLNGK